MNRIEDFKEEELLSGNKIFLFSAEWCIDCVALKAYIDEVIQENKEWEFIYVDTDKNMDFSEENGILGIPSFVAYMNGKRVADLISKDAKPKSLINSWIKTIGKI